jgi:hypothetical protein
MTARGEANAREASAAPEGRRLMISERMNAPLSAPRDQTGAWVAAGVIDDEGDATVTPQVTQQDGGRAVIEATHVLTSRDDPAQRLELESRTTVRPIPPPPPNRRVLAEGTWRLVRATKAYASLRAGGRMYGTLTDRVSEGRREITFVLDGSAE